MKLALIEHTPQNIRRARKILRRTTSLRLFVRGGKCFTVTYNPGRQPNSQAQLSNRSLFKQANDMVAADFANTAKRNYWLRKLRSQSHYKTARGLARAHYMTMLKARAEKQNLTHKASFANCSLLTRGMLHASFLSPVSLSLLIPKHLALSQSAIYQDLSSSVKWQCRPCSHYHSQRHQAYPYISADI